MVCLIRTVPGLGAGLVAGRLTMPFGEFQTWPTGGGGVHDDGSGTFEETWEPGDGWDLPEPGDVAPSDGVPGPGPELEPDGGDSDVGPAQGDESSSCSLQEEEESDDADRMAELAGVRVAEAIDGEDSAQVGSFFRHVVSVFES